MADFSGIRKRCEESRRLLRTGEEEVALILALVAVSAASRVRGYLRNWDRNRDGKPPDRMWFVRYLSERSKEETQELNEKLCSLVYSHLRCEMIHEATYVEKKHDVNRTAITAVEGDSSYSFVLDDKAAFKIADGKLTFGPGLAAFLVSLVESDSDLLSLWPEVRDYWHRLTPDPKDQVLIAQLTEDIGCRDDGSVETLLFLLETVGPEQLRTMNVAEISSKLSDAFFVKGVKNFEGWHITALRNFCYKTARDATHETHFPLALFARDSLTLTSTGLNLLKLLSERFESVEPPDLRNLPS